ncbi:ankyrin repeat-containing domain protein [Xylaria arbuscula]|nr:ankyrin repeat-containing domain protein [Xylaria arbuscula]
MSLCVQHTVEDGADQTLRVLLEYRSKIDLTQQDHAGNTALHKIRKEIPLAVVKLLDNVEADLNTINNEGYTPLAVAIEVGNTEVSGYLLSRTGSKGSGPLHRASFHGNLDLIKMIVERGGVINEVDSRIGETPLYTHLRGSSPSLQIIQYLVDTTKADVNMASTSRRYPIIQACKKYDRGIIHFVVEAGADVNVKDIPEDKLGRTAVHYAAALADEEDLEKLLDLSEIDVNQRDDDGWTPLIWACQQRRTYNFDYVVQVLLNRGADIWDILHPGHEHFDPIGERFGPESEDAQSSEEGVPSENTEEPDDL